jgi:hypothetical protein
LCERKIKEKLPKTKKNLNGSSYENVLLMIDDIPKLEDKRKRKNKGKKE